MKISIRLLLCALGLVFVSPSALCAQIREAATVDSASQVLDEIMTIPARKIPESMLADAQGIVIIPDLLKGSFVVGVRHGRGIVLVRDDQGAWRPPEFVSLTGGSLGWQIGLQSTDIILVFKTRNSVKGLLNGKFTLGADAAAAAGPIGREMAAATDTSLKAEIYSYSLSRGLFAGVSLDGSVLQMDREASALYYSGAGTTTPGVPGSAMPPSANRFLCQLTKYTGAPALTPKGEPGPILIPIGPPQAAVVAPAPVVDVRQQLADSSLRLYTTVDTSWKAYLTLPPEIYTGVGFPNAQAMGQTVGRYDTVVQDPRYRDLANRAEFRATYDLLRRYMATASRNSQPTPAALPQR